MSRSSIEWTDRVWNPVRGCSRISEGCRNCYAEKIAARFSGAGKPFEGFARIEAPHGPGARPFDVAWAFSTLAACRAAAVACFVKQLGARPIYYDDARDPACRLALADRKGADMAEWPEDLRVREFPS